MKLRKGDGLLVVDMQNDFITGSLAVPTAEQTVDPVTHLISVFTRARLPIFVTQDDHPPHHTAFQGFGGLWPPHCVTGTDGQQLHRDVMLALLFAPDVVMIAKGQDPTNHPYSGFGDTMLDHHLKEREINRIFVCGLALDWCVRDSALDARKLGYEVYLVYDAMAAVNLKPTDEGEAVFAMASAGCRGCTSNWVGR